jgi:glycogen(starch) synthase
VRLLILSHVELTRDPRPRRQASAASGGGYEVVGICPVVHGYDPLPLEEARVVRIRGDAVAAKLRQAGLAGVGRKREGALVLELRGLYRLWRFARTNLRLFRAARREGTFDVVLANEIETLPAGWALARRTGARLVYDAHEIYESSEPDHPWIHRHVTALAERLLARRSDRVLTVSEPIADELQQRLRLRERPVAILNAPSRFDVPEAARHDGPLRVVYQGAMAASRPVDDLLDAAEAAHGIHVTIRVANADLDALRADVARRGIGDRVDIADPVSPTALVEALVDQDVGVILNRPLSRNDELVFPNKLFEYMMAGLAVVAPRLPGITPLVEGEGIGVTFTPADAASLGARLAELAADPDRVLALRRQARALAVERYNAETEATRFIAAIAG